MKRPWTTLEVRRLEGMRSDGLTVAECARELGRSWASVRNVICRRLLRRGGRWPRGSRLRAWWLLFQVPHTVYAAAREMGASVNCAKNAKARLRQLGYEVCPSRGRQAWRKERAGAS